MIEVEDVDAQNTKVDGDKTEALLGRQSRREWDYRPLSRRFYSDRWWVWGIQAVAYAVVLVLYCITDGKEIAYAVYIPVDFVLFVGMAAFYFVQWKVALEKKEDEQQKIQLILDKTKSGVTGLMQSIKSRVENKQAENEINLAA